MGDGEGEGEAGKGEGTHVARRRAWWRRALTRAGSSKSCGRCERGGGCWRCPRHGSRRTDARGTRVRPLVRTVSGEAACARRALRLCTQRARTLTRHTRTQTHSNTRARVTLPIVTHGPGHSGPTQTTPQGQLYPNPGSGFVTGADDSQARGRGVPFELCRITCVAFACADVRIHGPRAWQGAV